MLTGVEYWELMVSFCTQQYHYIIMAVIFTGTV